MTTSVLQIIYTDNEMVLSKIVYFSWREIQDEYGSYKASLGPWSADEVTIFLASEYPALHPSAEEQVQRLLDSAESTCLVTFCNKEGGT